MAPQMDFILNIVDFSYNDNKTVGLPNSDVRFSLIKTRLIYNY